MTEAATHVAAPIERLGTDSIRLERLLDATPEKVWSYLTIAEFRRDWFMGGTDAKADSDFELIVDHDNLSDENVPYPEEYSGAKGLSFRERVIRFDPPKLLETTFQGGKNGTVTYELHPHGAGTRLVLTHRGIASASGFKDFGSGWNSHLTVLQERLAGRSIRNFWAMHAKSRDAVSRALG